jgi:hypothetical protein
MKTAKGKQIMSANDNWRLINHFAFRFNKHKSYANWNLYCRAYNLIRFGTVTTSNGSNSQALMDRLDIEILV